MITFIAVGMITMILVYASFKYFTRPSLSMIRGPDSPSFVFGNLLEIYQRPAAEADFTWQKRYGNVVRFKSIFGEDQLMVTDPKALQKIYNISEHNYTKPPGLRIALRMLVGKGISWVNGEDHKRQKNIMLPGFGLKENRAFLPMFKECAESLSMKWLEIIGNNDGQSVVMNILPWLSRGALDAVGQAAFDVQFNSIQNDLHPLAKTYRNYLGEIFGLPSAEQIFIQAASEYIPMWILEWFVDHGSNSRIAHARYVKDMVTDFAKELLREKADALLQGKGNRDIFTLLVKANMDAKAKNKLNDEELLAQMRTLLIAGHESTANSISWILLELARKPQVQSRLRDEIRKAEATIQARGDSQLAAPDLDALPYLNAVIREGLRFHPAAPHNLRMVHQDDVLPLSKPILTRSGDMINEVLVPGGTRMIISIAAYNRDKDLWGEDAHEFNPDRWLDGGIDEKKIASIGVYSNLLTFISGNRACLGWRFAVMELQAFLFELVGKFGYKMTDKAERIIRKPALVMVPMIDGEIEQGIQLPLVVSLASQDGEI